MDSRRCPLALRIAHLAAAPSLLFPPCLPSLRSLLPPCVLPPSSGSPALFSFLFCPNSHPLFSFRNDSNEPHADLRRISSFGVFVVEREEMDLMRGLLPGRRSIFYDHEFFTLPSFILPSNPITLLSPVSSLFLPTLPPLSALSHSVVHSFLLLFVWFSGFVHFNFNLFLLSSLTRLDAATKDADKLADWADCLYSSLYDESLTLFDIVAVLLTHAEPAPTPAASASASSSTSQASSAAAPGMLIRDVLSSFRLFTP